MSQKKDEMNDTEQAEKRVMADQSQFLSFTLGTEEYGVDILRVQEIRSWEPVSRIPNVPHYEKGVVNLRGAIVPIIDLRERFNMEKVEYSPMTVVIVMCIETETAGPTVMGIVADAVSDVLDINLSEIKNAPNLGSKINTRYIRGMYVGKHNMVMLLDVDKLLNPEEFTNISGFSVSSES